MRANFTRGGDPYKKLDIGNERESTYPRTYDDLPSDVKKTAFQVVYTYKKKNENHYIKNILETTDGLFEPDYDELLLILGQDYADWHEYNHNKYIIEHSYKEEIDYDTDKINLRDVITISNEEFFLTWLGISQKDIDNNISYIFGPDYIELNNDYLDEELDDYVSYESDLDAANEKWEAHCIVILGRIKDLVKAEFSNEGIEKTATEEEWWFDRYGQEAEAPVNEAENFTRGGDPYKKLNVGDVRLWPKEYANLDDGQKEMARDSAQTEINNRRQHYDDRGEWITDGDYVLEPDDDELFKMFGKNFYKKLNKHNKDKDKPLIGNDGSELYFSLDRNYYINLKDAIQVNNEYYFFLWLGIPESMHEGVYYMIGKDTISFEENDCDHEFCVAETEILDAAVSKFEAYCQEKLKYLKDAYEWYDTKEGIESEIEGQEWRFTKDGDIVNEAFSRGGNPYKKLGIGTSVQITKWMEEKWPDIQFKINDDMQLELDWRDIPSIINISYPDYIKVNLLPHIDEYNFMLYLDIEKILEHTDVDGMEDGSDDKLFFELIRLKQLHNDDTVKLKEFESKLRSMYAEFGDDTLKNKSARSVLEKSYQQISLLFAKINRDERQMMEDELFNTYIFIGFDDYKEVTIDGEDYHKKYMNIENLYKIDRFNKGELDSVSMMKIRAQTVDNGSTYGVKIPKWMVDNDYYYDEDIDDKLRAYVDEHKFKL